MESSTASNCDKYISISKLIFQLVNGKVHLERLSNIYLQKSLASSCNASKISSFKEDKETQSQLDNYEEGKKIQSEINSYQENKENQPVFDMQRDKNSEDLTVNNNGEYQTIRRNVGGAVKELMLAYCRSCDKEVVGIGKTCIRCKVCGNRYCVFKCGKCGSDYTKFRSLITHLYKVCNPLTEFRCCSCDYKCFRAIAIQIHVRKHKSLSSLGERESEHQDQEIHCDLCHFTTSSKGCLLIHLKAKHPDTVAAPPNEEEPKKLDCINCGKVFMNKTGLREHSVFCQKSPKLKCRYCPHKAYRSSMMKQHMKKEHAEFVKVESNGEDDERRKKKEAIKKKILNDEEELPYTISRIQMDSQVMVRRFCADCKQPHVKPKRRTTCLACGGEIYYACTKCEMTFPNYPKVKNHVRFTCFGRRLFHCKKCNCTRTTKEFMLRHLSKDHSGDKK